MRIVCKILTAFVLFCSCLLLSTAIAHSQSSNIWTNAGQLVQARTGASAVMLSDGRVLITGGTDGNGVPMAATELYDPSTGQFAEGPAMNVPRANHAAILLSTGDVLVTGGLSTGGGFTDTAEIFNGSTQQWILLQASLGTGLAKHAMAALSDGNVLIAGGETTAGPVSSILIYHIADQSITSIGSLIIARADAAAAATPDGRVLISGGTDINGAVLNSTELFVYSADSGTGTVSAGPNMTYPRAKATATSTYDGVAIIGGNNGSLDLGTAEIFSQWTNAFRVVNGATPRSGHFAILLPKNGAILATGGTGGSAVDLLQPWANSLAGGFFAAAGSLNNHVGGFAAPATLGSLLTAGGQDAASDTAELYWFPTIATDQPDYAPGTPVVMTGTGFKPAETVDLHLHEWVNQTVTDLPDYMVTASSNGSFIFTGYAPTTTDVGARYHLTAVGESSTLQAQTIFTDGPSTVNVALAFSGSNPGTVSNSLNSSTCTWNGTSSSGSGCTFPNVQNGASITFTATPGANWTGMPQQWTRTGCTPGSGICSVGPFGNKDGTLTVTFVAASTTTSLTSPSITYGQTAASTVIVTNTSGSGSPTGSVSMTISGGGSASCTSLAVATSTTSTSTCTISYSAGGVASSPYTLSATYTPSGAFASSSGVGTLTVDPAPLTITAINESKTYGQTFTPDGSTQFSLSGLLGSDTVTSVTLTSSGYAATAGVAGSPYDIVPSAAVGTGLSNYSISYINGKLTVNPASLTATVTADPKQYDGTTAATLNCSLPSGVFSGDAVSCTATGAFASKDVATPQTVNISNIALSGAQAGNYGLTATTGTTSANITPAPLTVSVTGVDKQYDAKTTATLNCTVTTGLISPDTSTCSATGTFTDANAGNGKTINISSVTASNTNYNIPSPPTTTSANITPAPLTITAMNESKTYGQTFTPDGSTQFTLSGLLGSDTVTSVTLTSSGYAATAGVAGSPYDIVPSAAVGTGLGNYTINYAKGTLTVNKANPVCTITSYSVTYDGNPHTATGVCKGVDASSLSGLDLSGTTHTNAGTYSDSWTFTDVTGNYNNASGPESDSIARANATITVTAYSVFFDGNAHTATGTATGVKGETLSGLDLSGTTHTLAGTYTDSWTFTDVTGNYKNDNGTLTDVIKHWTVTGFYSPVVPTTNTVVWNVIKGGSTVPLKFNIYAGSVQQTTTAAVQGGSVVVYQANCNIGGWANTATDLLTDTGATALRYDTTGLQFIQNWKTPKGQGCYVAQMTAADGTSILAYFTAN